MGMGGSVRVLCGWIGGSDEGGMVRWDDFDRRFELYKVVARYHCRLTCF